MKCFNCNSDVEESDKFCPYCGVNLKEKLKVEQAENKKNNLPNTIVQNQEIEQDLKLENFDVKIESDENEIDNDIKGKKSKSNKKNKKSEKSNSELQSLENEKKNLEAEIESLKKKIKDLKKEYDELTEQLEEYEKKKEEYKRKEVELDHKEIELNEREQQLNEKYLELLNFENELIEKKKQIEENELNMFLAKELKDDSKYLSDHVVSDIQKKEDFSMMNKAEIEISNLIEFSREFLNKGMIDAAIHVYKKIEQKYYENVNNLPNAVLQKLHLKIIELYDDIHLKLSEMKHGNQ
ncbi:MAG: zinc ribbon domain-containing protein [Candidatus Woesearchaeota archaeon]